MEISSIDELVKLAGLVKQQELATEAEVEEDCGCDDTAQTSVAVNSPDMYAILQRLAQMGEVHEDEIVDEWANTPDQTGEPEARVMDLPKGEPVDTSLRRYLGANGQPVKVEEAVKDHTVEEMMEAYSAFKAEEQLDEADHNDMPSKAHVMKMCKDGMSEAEMLKMHPEADEDKLKQLIKDCKEEMKESVEESAVEEADVEEDNAFNTAAANAKKAGKSEFEFNGKKYKVKMDAKTADALTDDINILKQLAGL